MSGNKDAPVQDSGAEEVGGFAGLSRGGKLAAIGGGLAVVVGLLVVPPLLSADTPTQEEQRDRRVREVVDLDRDPPRDDPNIGAGTTGGGDTGRRRRIAPPPIAISTNTGTVADAGLAAPGRRSALAGGDGAGGVGSGRDDGAGGGGDGGGNDPHTSLSGQLSGGIQRAVVQGRTLRNADYVITSHTAVPCLPVQPHNTRMGGIVTCVTQDWIRGTTQRRGVLPPGTLIKGQIKGGAAQHQREIGVLYTQIETSGDRFQIDMQGLAAGAMGQPGLSGDVKTFFGEQAAAVALYALIQGVSNAIPQAAGALANRAAGGGVFFNFGGGGLGGGNSLADTALRHRLNRPPEIDRGPAVPAHVMVAVDLDFSKVCRQRQRINPMACPRM